MGEEPLSMEIAQRSVRWTTYRVTRELRRQRALELRREPGREHSVILVFDDAIALARAPLQPDPIQAQ